MSGLRICVVCGDKTKHGHLGAVACRACGQFFRRTLLAGRTFICRQGDDKCVIRKHVPNGICRKCRIDRCHEVGMKLTGKELDEIAARGPSASRDRPSLQGSYEDLRLANSSDFMFLRRIAAGYRDMCTVRKARELLNRKTTSSCKSRKGHKTPTLRFTQPTYSQLDSAQRILFSALFEFADDVLDGFSKLSDVDRGIIIRDGHYPFLVTEGFRRAMEEFPHEPNMLFVSYAHYIHRDELDTYYIEAPSEEFRKEALTIVEKTCTELLRHLRPLVIGAAMDETEFAAFFGLSLCCPAGTAADLSDEAISKLHEFRARIFYELHLYYKYARRMRNYSIKLGRMMMLLCACQEFNAKAVGELDVYRLLDMVTEESFFSQFQISLCMRDTSSTNSSESDARSPQSLEL